MFDVLGTTTLVGATIATGLTAGLFYAYSCSVMPGLARTDDRTFVNAMQHVNVAILNGWFAAAFVGAPVLMIMAGALHLGNRSVLPWIAVAFVLYGAALVITARINVPHNNQLATAASEGTDLAKARDRFEKPWVRWNLARSVLCTAAFACLAWALVLSR
ncbi:MAG TPA: anthrone oxygenase family protein [Micromonosporaceae bacterium]|nr:anthrone oxygenase family protein [Micromonosporaceae bacterium]